MKRLEEISYLFVWFAIFCIFTIATFKEAEQLRVVMLSCAVCFLLVYVILDSISSADDREIKRLLKEERNKRMEERMRKPTREERQVIMAHKLLPDEWMVVDANERFVVVRYAHGKTVRKLDRSVNKWRD